MKDLEDIYTENFLVPVRPGATKEKPPISKKERIEKIQGLFSSLKLGLQQLQNDFEQTERFDNGFSETLDTIDGALETPFAIFDSTFFRKREEF